MNSAKPLLWIGSQSSFDEPHRGFWVAAPVVLHHIIVETPSDIEDSDPFARVVVNLTAAGVHRVTDIADLIGIEDIRFVSEVIRRLENRDIVSLTDGIVTLRKRGDDMVGRAGRKEFWYGVQDTYSGTLWPRASVAVQRPNFRDEDRQVELGTPGRPAKLKFWQMPDDFEVEGPDATSVTQALLRHLSDMRTVGLKSNRVNTKHLAFLGRPEMKPTFSARLSSTSEQVRLLIRLDTYGNEVFAADPFEVGAWFELGMWTNQLLDRSPALREKVVAWAEGRNVANQRRTGRDHNKVTGSDHVMPMRPDETLSRTDTQQATVDRNTLLLALADQLRRDIGRAAEQNVGLTYESGRDAESLLRRWTLLGFHAPSNFVKPVAALIERAVEGHPADLHTLFYAWTLLVDVTEGQALALRMPDLPAILYDHAVGRTQTAVPDVRPQGLIKSENLKEIEF